MATRCQRQRGEERNQPLGAATVALLLGLAWIGGACSFGDDDLGPTALASVESLDQLELTSSGMEPRAILRYQFESSRQYTVVSTASVRVRQQVLSAEDGTPLPQGAQGRTLAFEAGAAVVTEARVVADRVGGDAANGNLFALRSEILATEVTNATSDEVAGVVSAAVEESVGATAVRLIDDRGRWHRQRGEADVAGFEGGLAEALGLSVGAEAEVRVDVIALPDEAVGVGATWTTTPAVDGVGERDEAFSFEVVGLEVDADGEPASLEVNVAQSWTGPAASTSLQSADHHLSGLVVIDLSRPVHQGVLRSSATHLASSETVLAGLDAADDAVLDGLVEQIVEVDTVTKVDE